MPERRTKRRSQQPKPSSGVDDRIQEKAETPGPGPSPYDVAEPGTPADRVIRKGQPEPPGPTEPVDTRDRSDYGDTPVDRDASTTTGGNALAGRELRDDVEESTRQFVEDTGDLGGEELHRRLNRQGRRASPREA